MKRVSFLILILMIVLSSCSSVKWRIGESSEDFMQRNRHRNFELVKQSDEWSVFKFTNGWSYDAPYFFYFYNNTLKQVDRGTRSPDIIIQQNRN